MLIDLKWIDTHAHLQLLKTTPKLRNIDKLICVATKLDDKLDFNIPGVKIYKTVGIHPCENLVNIDFALLESQIDEKTVAIGETGLDLYKNSNSLELQTIVFKAQINIAIKHNLPIIIHTRNTNYELLAILDEFPNLNGVIHSFEGNLEFLQNLLKYPNIYISLSGLVTKKRLPITYIPLEKLLLETDCPYLTPQTLGNIENHPTYIQYIAMYISNLLNISLTKLSTITCENTLRLFTKMKD